MKKLAGTALLAIAVVLAWMGLSPFIASFPFLGAGIIFVPQHVGPLLIIDLLVLLLSLILLRVKGMRKLTTAAAIFSVIAAGANAGLLDQQKDHARKAGADPNVLAAFMPGGRAGGEGPDEVTEYSAGPGDKLPMDVYIPAEIEGDKAPVLMYIHGGMWDSGSRDDQARNLRWLADQGFLVVAPEYTLATDDKPTWDVAAQEVICAMGWVTEHVQDYRGDADNFFTYGEAAGAALAMTASYDVAEGKTGLSCVGHAGTGPAPAIARAVYADSAAVDPRSVHSINDEIKRKAARTSVERYLGGSPADYPERADAVTVANHVGPNSQPTYLIHSGDDRLIPNNSYGEYRQRMNLANRSFTEIVRPHSDHSATHSARGMWNQMVLQTVKKHFAGEDAFGYPGGRPPVGGEVPQIDPETLPTEPVGGVPPAEPKTRDYPLGGNVPQNPKTRDAPLGGNVPQ